MTDSYGLDPRVHQQRRDIETDATDVSSLVNRNQQRRGNFGKGDVANAPLTLTLDKFRFIELPGDTEKKLKIYFSDYERPYISNKTNVDTLAIMFQSTKLSDWKGEKVTFYLDPITLFEDQQVGGIRVCESEEALPEHVVEFYASLTEGKGSGGGREEEAQDISETG